jgi:hypothetical protein
MDVRLNIMLRPSYPCCEACNKSLVRYTWWQIGYATGWDLLAKGKPIGAGVHQAWSPCKRVCNVCTVLKMFQILVKRTWSVMEEEVEVTLRLTISQSVCLGIEHPCGTCDQILLPVGMLLSEICDLVSVGRPLWRVDGSAICSVISQWSKSRKIRNHTLLSHLRLPQPGKPGSLIYIPQEQGGPVITSQVLQRQLWTD